MLISSKVGSFQLSILEVLRGKRLHGYAIISELESKTGHRPTSSSMYPALRKLERLGLIEGTAERTNGRHQVVYALTQDGLEELGNVFGMGAELCLRGIQKEIQSLQEGIFSNLVLNAKSIIFYPCTIWESIRSLAETLVPRGVHQIIVLVPSKRYMDLINKSIKSEGLSRRIKVIIGDLENIPLQAEFIDTAILPFALCRCTPRGSSLDPVKALKEIARILSPNGKIVLIDLEEVDHAALRMLFQHANLCGYDREEIEELLTRCGFTLNSISCKSGIILAEGVRMIQEN